MWFWYGAAVLGVVALFEVASRLATVVSLLREILEHSRDVRVSIEGIEKDVERHVHGVPSDDPLDDPDCYPDRHHLTPEPIRRTIPKG